MDTPPTDILSRALADIDPEALAALLDQAPAAIDPDWRIPDAMWACIAPLLPVPPPRPKGGRPRKPDRPLMDAIFYLLRTGGQWHALPPTFDPPSTVHDRYQAWVEAGVFARMWEVGLLTYEALRGLEWEWQAMDGAMTKAPLGGSGHGPQPHGPGQTGRETLPADRRAGDALGGRRGRGQSP